MVFGQDQSKFKIMCKGNLDDCILPLMECGERGILWFGNIFSNTPFSPLPEQ